MTDFITRTDINLKYIIFPVPKVLMYTLHFCTCICLSFVNRQFMKSRRWHVDNSSSVPFNCLGFFCAG